jgi:alkanesulfonate monooxygenase SsuD/methylene tetrahydromethanopterin reductase-like flavin-dependent oxidoreductase (luciferase family)
MRISVAITDFSWPGPTTEVARHLTDVADAAEAGGLDGLWVADHLLQADPNSRLEAEMLEAYTTLGFLAARTRRVRLGAR